MTRRLLILGRAMLITAASVGHVLAAELPLQDKLTKLGYARGEPIEKIQNYRVDSWNYIDDQHIMIYAGPSVRYLISTLGSCSDLATAEHIGFSSTANSLTKFDKLVVRGAGGMVRSCPIDAMYQLNSLKNSAH